MLYRKTLIINEFYHLMQKPNGKSEVNHYKSIIYPIIYPIIYKNTFSQHPSQLSPTILSSLHFLPFSSMRLYFTILSPSLQQLLFHYHSPPHSSSPLPPILPLLSTSPPSTFTLFPPLPNTTILSRLNRTSASPSHRLLYYAFNAFAPLSPSHPSPDGPASTHLPTHFPITDFDQRSGFYNRWGRTTY